MKRRYKVCLIFILLLGITGCGSHREKEEESLNFIEPAKLTEEEKDILNVCGTEQKEYAFDFAVDEKTEGMHIRISELQDGQWQTIGKNSYDEIDGKGRFAIAGDDFGKSYRIGFANNHSTWEAEEKEEDTSLGVTTAVLREKTEIVYGKEIPLLIQIKTSKNEISTYQVEESFAHPERYKDAGYEHIYAVTIMFF